MTFLLRALRFIGGFFFVIPVIIVSFLTMMWFAINDAYETAVIGDIVASLPDQASNNRSSWITPDGNIALRAGQLTAGAPYNPYTGARYPGCVAILLAQGSIKSGSFSPSNPIRNDEVDTFFPGADLRVGGISLDATFLNNRLLKGEITQEDNKSYKRVFGDCGRDCFVQVTCIKPQMVSVLADLNLSSESSAQLVYPPLNEKEYPLLQYGRLGPAAYHASYLRQLPELASLNHTKVLSIMVLMLVFFLLFIGQKRGSIPAYVMALPLLLPWLSYYTMAWPPVTTLLLLTAAASLVLSLMTTASGLKLKAAGADTSTSALLRNAEKALYTPGPVVTPRSSLPPAAPPAPASFLPPVADPPAAVAPQAPATSAPPVAIGRTQAKPASKAGGLPEKALAELLERLNPLTLSALSPSQLETTVLNHLQRQHDSETAALTRDELQQLVQQIAKALAGKAQSVRR